MPHVLNCFTEQCVRGLVTRFPITFALLSAATFLAILSSILAACTLPMALRKAYQTDTVQPETEYASTASLSAGVTPESDTKPLPRRRKSKPRLGIKRAVSYPSIHSHHSLLNYLLSQGSKSQTSAVSTSQTKLSIRRRALRTSDRATDRDP